MKHSDQERDAGGPVMERICDCGHPASAHELLDHDKNGNAAWRREQKLSRWHLICTADVKFSFPDAEDDSPWDHVCGCITNVWEQEPSQLTVDSMTSPVMREMLRDALRNYKADA